MMNLNIRTKLFGGFALLLTLALGFGVLATWELLSLTKTMNETHGKEKLVGRAQNALWELRYGFPQFILLTGAEDRKKITDAEPRLYEALEANLKKYSEEKGLDSKEMEAVQKTKEAFSKYKEKRPMWFSLIAEGKTEEAAAWRAQYTTPLGAAAVASMNNLRDTTIQEDEERYQDRSKALSLALWLFSITGVVIVVVGVAVAFRIYRSISQPLGKLQRTIEDISGGDYEARAKLGTSDELGLLGRSFDTLLDERGAALATAQSENEQLNNSVILILQSVNDISNKDLTVRAPVTHDIIGTVSDSINQLTEETGKVLQEVSDIANRVEINSNNVRAQAQLVTSTAAQERHAVAQMIDSLADATQYMNQVAALTESASDAADQATQVTDGALQTVNGTVKGMDAIRETIAEAEKRIKRLGERSQEISGIVNLINTISERTHVLALNASMQAAVAGEAGRGFAVVAEEVQRLAESSRNATQQIAVLVGNIQLETNETINTVNQTIAQVVSGSELAQQAGAQMRHTQQITAELVQQVRRIAGASEQQKSKSADLLLAVQEIGNSTERTSQQIESQNVETESLLGLARSLVQSVSVFKLPKTA